MHLQPTSDPFLGAPTCSDTDEVETSYAFLGIPFGPPYEAADLTVSASAADAVRASARLMEYSVYWSHYDFDLGEELFPGDEATVTDCGDIVADVRDPDAIWERAVSAIRPLVAAGRVPLVVGGLDSIPPMVVEPFEGVENINVLHVDAHLDFRDEVGGVRRGYSSPIRRIRELDCVDHVVQVGLRAVGSARPAEVCDARDAGNTIVTAWELHDRGVESFLQSLPAEGRWVVTIDCDGLDPSIAPAVGWPEPGGVTFHQIRTILAHLAGDNRVAAVVFTEFRPGLSGADITAQTIARLFINVIGLQRQPERRPA